MLDKKEAGAGVMGRGKEKEEWGMGEEGNVGGSWRSKADSQAGEG